MWHEFIIKYYDDQKEPLTAVLFGLGCEGISEEPGVLKAYFPESVPPEQVSEALRTFDDVRVEHASLEEQDWYKSWKDSFSPFEVDGIVVCPPWKECMPMHDKKLMLLDPGQAFGAGEHITTQTVMKMMRAWVELQSDLPTKRFLDLGTGTGILAITAYLLGIKDITAVDVEVRAVETAARNFALNGMVGKVRLMPGSISEAGKGYDLIAANIFLEVLVEIIPQVASALNPGGRLIISGFLAGQKEEMIKAAGAAGLILEEIVDDGRWVSALLRA